MNANASTVGAGRKRPKTGGRKAGTPNKLTGDVKAMVLQALEGVGGVKYLQAAAGTHPQAFLALVGKVLPLQIAGDANAPLVVKIVQVTTEAERAKAWQK